MINKIKQKKFCIGIIGLGYVGLPLAIEFAKFFDVIGFDKNISRIKMLKKNHDFNLEVKSNNLRKSPIIFTNNYKILSKCNIFIITVPTPILNNKKPDLRMIKDATNLITKVIKKKDIIVLESTVYPGVTENVVGKIIQNKTNYKLNKDFFLGYSPERINPGDTKHTITKITKIVSASDKSSLKILSYIYSKIINKGIHKSESIKIAEAAKVIENVQRDVNIALMNEFEAIFDKMNINSKKIFDAAYTKWNFLKFKPGLVGGHCIGIDPHYLINIAIKNNYTPQIIINSRKLNEKVPYTIFKKISNQINIKKKNVLILGATFKENCPDVRNSKVYDVFKLFTQKGHYVEVYEPVASSDEIIKIYGKNAIFKINKKYDVILFLVPHKFFLNLGANKLKKFLVKSGFIFDYKYIFSENQILKLI